MGWWNRFLSYFLEEEHVQADLNPNLKHVHILDLDEWLEVEESKLVARFNLDQLIIVYSKKLKDTRWLFECRLDEWEERLNYRINYKTNEIKLFFLETRKLLDLITFPENINVGRLKKLCMIIEFKINLLVKKIEQSLFSKNFSFILSDDQKYSHEIAINPFLQELINLNGIIDEFNQKIEQSGWKVMEKLKEKASILGQRHERIKILVNDFNEREKRLGLTESKRNEKLALLEELKSHPDYVDLNDVNNEEEKLIKDLEENEDKVFLFFSKLKSALSKFIQLHPDHELAQKYLEKSTVFFYEDEDLEVLNLLKQLKEALHFQTIKLDPLQTSSLLQQIDETSLSFLKNLQDRHSLLKVKLSELRELQESKEINNQIAELNYKVNHFTQQIEKLGQEVAQLREELDKSSALEIKEIELFKNLVKVSLDKEIEIRV